MPHLISPSLGYPTSVHRIQKETPYLAQIAPHLRPSFPALGGSCKYLVYTIGKARNPPRFWTLVRIERYIGNSFHRLTT